MLQSLFIFAQQTGHGAALPEVKLPPTNTTIAITHALLSVLGALSIALAYYSNSAMKRPNRKAIYLQNAKLMFLGSLLPAPVAGWCGVAMMNGIATFTRGDYRYEWAIAFAGGTVGAAFIKKLGAGLLTQEVFPKSAPQGEENQ